MSEEKHIAHIIQHKHNAMSASLFKLCPVHVFFSSCLHINCTCHKNEHIKLTLKLYA